MRKRLYRVFAWLVVVALVMVNVPQNIQVVNAADITVTDDTVTVTEYQDSGYVLETSAVGVETNLNIESAGSVAQVTADITNHGKIYLVNEGTIRGDVTAAGTSDGMMYGYITNAGTMNNVSLGEGYQFQLKGSGTVNTVTSTGGVVTLNGGSAAEVILSAGTINVTASTAVSNLTVNGTVVSLDAITGLESVVFQSGAVPSESTEIVCPIAEDTLVSSVIDNLSITCNGYKVGVPKNTMNKAFSDLFSYISTDEVVDFGADVYGNPMATAKTYTVPLGGTGTVEVTVPTAQNFIIEATKDGSLFYGSTQVNEGEVVEFSITPKDGLDVGDYSEYLSYKVAGVTKGFDCSYEVVHLNMPVDPITFLGTKGENDYYLTDVELMAKDGYQISEELDGIYVDRYSCSEGKTDMKLYLMEIATGAKTAAYEVPAFGIDKVEPVIAGIEEPSYCVKDSITATISDENLASITVNGDNYSFVEGATTVDVALTAGAESKDYTIVVTDMSGRSVTKKVTLEPYWTKYQYSITPTNIVFDDAYVKYTSIASKVVNFINDGTVEFSPTWKISAEDFDITFKKASEEVKSGVKLAKDDMLEISIKPKTDLDIGVHEGKIVFDLDGKEETISFNIEVIDKLTATGKITMEDFYYGQTPKEPVVTSDITAKPDITYYAVGDEENADEKVPTKPGKYVVKAVFPETTAYKALKITDTFSVNYLPLPEKPVVIDGTKGNEEYYVSDVIVTAAKGYLVSKSETGTYEESIICSSSVDSMQVYLKQVKTNAITKPYHVGTILIDKTAPVCRNIANNATYYMDRKEIAIVDANLKSVTVNNKQVSVAAGETTVVLELLSHNGSEVYVIEAEDKAGNKVTCTVRISASWMENMIIPSNTNIKLYKTLMYNLDVGNWKVEGDNTTYVGGKQIYVENDGEYIFIKE